MASDSPSHRVEGLEEAGLLERSEAGVGKGGAEHPLLGARRDAALLLGYLERMGEPYGPPEVGLFLRCVGGSGHCLPKVVGQQISINVTCVRILSLVIW